MSMMYGVHLHENILYMAGVNTCVDYVAVDGDDGEGTVCHTVYVARWS